MSEKCVLLAGALAGLLLCVGASAVAGPILDFTGGLEAFGVGTGGTIGWEFTVSSPVTVGGLGVFDVRADGLAASHEIGLWTGRGTLLASATITTANSTAVASTSPNGDWRSITITPLTLLAGNYVIGATYLGGDPDNNFENATISTVPGVTFDIAKIIIGSGLLFPTTDELRSGPGYFGPNLFEVPFEVPEPSSLLLLGFALIAFIGRISSSVRRSVIASIEFPNTDFRRKPPAVPVTP